MNDASIRIEFDLSLYDFGCGAICIRCHTTSFNVCARVSYERLLLSIKWPCRMKKKNLNDHPELFSSHLMEY